MPPLLRSPACPGARPCPGRSSLDMTCAPAEYGSYQEARTGKISQIKVSTLSGEPQWAKSYLSITTRPVGFRNSAIGLDLGFYAARSIR